jgi:hypothetical protein
VSLSFLTFVLAPRDSDDRDSDRGSVPARSSEPTLIVNQSKPPG